MTHPSRPSLLQRLIGRSAPVQDDDPADMGTAIGLDFMLDQPPLPESTGTADALPADADHDWPTRLWAV